jgi:hypothetical protein
MSDKAVDLRCRRKFGVGVDAGSRSWRALRNLAGNAAFALGRGSKTSSISKVEAFAYRPRFAFAKERSMVEHVRGS